MLQDDKTVTRVAHTVYDENKAHVLINVHPLFRTDLQTSSFSDQIDVNILKVNNSMLPAFSLFMYTILQNIVINT